jgi:mRNA-degrading endonuclease toxin of MazEF toxin-antitoxin module
MGTITVGTIVGNASAVLQDASNVQWTVSEMIAWVNDGSRAIVIVRPDANATTGQSTSVAGTRQTIPTDGHLLLDVVRNMGTDGATAGRAITRINRRTLDMSNPLWHETTPAAEAQHFVFDARNPKVFYTYPPMTAGTKIELVYARPPALVAALTDPITIDDVYATPLTDYVLFRAFSKDNSAGNLQRATFHLSAFTAALSAKTSVDQETAGQVQPAGGSA